MKELNKSKLKVVGILSIIIIIGLFIRFRTTHQSNSPTQPTVIQTQPSKISFLNNQAVELSIEIADNDEERRRGLMNRNYLGENEGMLFLLEGETQTSFWMKDTFIPLDIIFIDKNKKITNIARNTKPNQIEEIYESSKSVLYVLEVNGGFTDANNINAGDSVIL